MKEHRHPGGQAAGHQTKPDGSLAIHDSGQEIISGSLSGFSFLAVMASPVSRRIIRARGWRWTPSKTTVDGIRPWHQLASPKQGIPRGSLAGIVVFGCSRDGHSGDRSLRTGAIICKPKPDGHEKTTDSSPQTQPHRSGLHEGCDAAPLSQDGGQSWIRTNVGVSQQIYSLPPLATRASTLQPSRMRGAVFWGGGGHLTRENRGISTTFEKKRPPGHPPRRPS